MKSIKRLTYRTFSVLLACLAFGCSLQEIEEFDKPFVHIMVDEASTIQVNANRRDAVDYNIYFSTPKTSKNLSVNYEVIPGDGLKEGLDYTLITTENPLAFPAGIFKRPIQIRWIEHTLNPEKDNTLTIRITGTTNKNVSVGLPGPDHNQSELIIEKVNN